MDINYYKKYEPIDGKWLITKKLGNGAFGTVFEIARKNIPDIKSALKIISIPQSSEELQRLKEENYDIDNKSITSFYSGLVDDCIKEFQLMSKLRGNSNIVSYEDHNVIEKQDGEFGWDIFIRMELLIPILQYFTDNAPTQQDIIKLGIDICKALEVCGKYNIIHRDIKPSNIFVSDIGEFKLGDFGVARVLDKTNIGLSRKGTYTYMAPEIYRGEEYDSSVDIYSLGIVMYKFLNNNLEPFRKERTYQDLENALKERMSNAGIPKPINCDEKLARIILKACAYDLKDRYSSPKQMREELENLLYTSEENDYDSYDETVGLFDFGIKKESVQQSEEKIINKTEKTQNIIDIYKEFWTGYFDFKGCISRINYWKIVLINFIILNIVNILSDILPVLNILLFIMCLAILIPNIALTTRRLHDVGKSGHWQWLYLTLFGSIAVFVFLCQKSQMNNKYRNKGAE